MDRENKIIEQVKQQGLLPLFYHDDKEVCLAVTKALYQAGVRCIEFTNRGPKALENFSHLVRLREQSLKDLVLAVGTIKSTGHAKHYIYEGADFLISPFFDHSIFDEAYLQKMTWVPGCMTPSEINEAEKAGCRLIKLFPGNVLGPAFVESIMPLFPNLDFVVTGGVDTTRENLAGWFKSGAAGVGMGSKLISKDVLQKRDYEKLATATGELLQVIQDIRKTR